MNLSDNEAVASIARVKENANKAEEAENPGDSEEMPKEEANFINL